MNKLFILISIAVCFFMSPCSNDEPKDKSELIQSEVVNFYSR